MTVSWERGVIIMTFEDPSVFKYENNTVKLNNGGVKSSDVNFDRDIYISR